MNAPSPSVIAIDGPAGSGKSSAARRLAQHLGFRYVDTGALYRAVGYAALRAGIQLDRVDAVRRLTGMLRLEVKSEPTGLRIWLARDEVTEKLRTPEVGAAASAVAAVPEVRARLLGLQRTLGAGGAVVMEGRDIGTVIFPEAPLKFYLDAAADVRARRRQAELTALGVTAGLGETRAQIEGRDMRDATRAAAPLRVADDAVTIDSTDLTLEQVVERMLALARERLGGG